MKAIAALTLFILTSAPHAAFGYDAAALTVLGFSPDGRYFAFEEVGDNEAGNYAITTAMEVAKSRPVGGSPFIGIEDNETLTGARAKAAMLTAKLRTAQPATLVITVPDAKVKDTANSTAVDALRDAAVKTLALPDGFGPNARLLLTETSRPSRKCDYGETGAIHFGLRLERSSVPPAKIGGDKNMPSWAGCPTNYGIAEVHALGLPDGATALAVIVQYFYFGFEGSDRRFMAVTALIRAR